MAEKTPQSYGDAVNRAQELIRVGRLADPGEHFPYKHDEVTALVAENPPAGPNGPDDASKRVADFMSTRIADTTNAYVIAQEAYLRDPGDVTKANYEEAADDLQAARMAHRRKRGGGMAISGQEG